MDHRLKCIMWNKLLENDIGENLGDLGFGDVYNTKGTIHERNTNKLDFVKIKNSALWKTLSGE